MKYKKGDIVLLYDEQTALILKVNSETKKYLVVNTDDNNGEAFSVSEAEIYMLVTRM
ncbi:MAG: hypothetical protein PHX51_06845 [Clostridia bacterium]|nr:hypothetical protein [Clostridia bacterium]MDD4291930.1 hypothetical protein [Clostridia bacterium]